METARAVVAVSEPSLRQFLVDHLRREGIQIFLASSDKECLALLERQRTEVLFADLDVLGANDEFVRDAASIQPRLSVIGLDGQATVESALRRSRSGRIEFLLKPFTAEALHAALVQALRRCLGSKSASSPSQPAASDDKRPAKERTPEAIIAESAAMRDVVKVLAKVAPTDATLLLEGEPGTGKRLLAREIHRRSRRACGPFLRIACGALREGEIDARLFTPPRPAAAGGHDPRTPSFLEQCQGGTLFLDDVTQLPPWAQLKLLDALQDGGPPGLGNATALGNVRVLAAVARDVDDALARNLLSADLYYYLSVVRIYIPPLRHRQQDIRALAAHFLACDNARQKAWQGQISPCRFSAEAWECLLHHDWPGNAAQLASVVAHAVVLTEGPEIGKSCIAEALNEQRSSPSHCDAIAVPLIGGLKGMERSIIDEVIQRCRGNKAAAARTLGLHRRTLYRLLEEGAAVKEELPTLPMTPDVAVS
jgi:DNA-binding NtrC family response regulator